MKRLLVVFLISCLILSLAGCGGKTSGPAYDAAPSGNQGSSDDSGKTGEQDVQMHVGGGDTGGGTVTGKIGDDLTWDESKVGGLPKPEGVTVKAGLDMTSISGKAYDFSYIVEGLTKENYNKYIEMLSKDYSDIRTKIISDDEGTFVASNGKQQVMVIWASGGETVINYDETK